MPKLAVVHVSDLHVRSIDDPCFRHVHTIAASCYDIARDADACLIAITGDVAFAGAADQYAAAREGFILALVADLEREIGTKVFVAIAPGNHDCVLIPTDEVRNTVIEAIVANPEKAKNPAMIEACVSAQKNFFQFIEELVEPEVKFTSKLMWQQSFDVKGKCVRVSSLNAAWMSTLPEQQGQLVYPVELFERELACPAYIHLALIHHPFNWYQQPAYQQLRGRVRRSCTAVLSGHEHVGNAGKIEEQISGSSLFFEAASLQPHNAMEQAGFSTYVFDLQTREVSIKCFAITSEGVHDTGGPVTRTWSEDGIVHSALDTTAEFAHELNDAGGNFTHADKERLFLEDIFVWPDIKVGADHEFLEQKVLSAESLIPALERGERLIVYGDDKSGKSTLLRWCFRELTALGYAAVYCPASEMNIRETEDARKRIEQLIEKQYRNPSGIALLEKSKRILLIDDIDRLRSGTRNIRHLIAYASRHFQAILAVATSDFEITNIASRDVISALAGFKSRELMRFGFKLRYRLIQKWCSLGNVNSKIELDTRIHDSELIVDTVVGKRLVPEYPLYLLILLQSFERHRHVEIQNSGLSFYYQFLITKGLGEVGVKPSELDEYFNYLSILAWKFQELQAKQLELEQIAILNADFSRRFIAVDLMARLDLLIRARIIARRGTSYEFSYPYIYFFFVGRFLSRNLENPEIRMWVEESCRRLYLYDRAHAVMFLTHHVEREWVIRLICQVLRECFSDKKPLELAGDIACFNALVTKSAQLTLETPDVEQNQVDVRGVHDELSEKESDAELQEFDALSFTSKWNLLYKTAGILGVILRNYYGSIERADKQDMIREVFEAPLRALRIWSEEIEGDLDALVVRLKNEELSKSGGSLTHENAERRVKKRIFNLICMVATGTVASAASFVASEKLRGDIMTVVEENRTNAYRLIDVASRLLKPGSVPTDAIRKLAIDLDGNPYAFGVLQTLGFVHMYMFHTDEIQKQSLCESLKISFSDAKVIEIEKRGRLLGHGMPKDRSEPGFWPRF